MRVPVEVEEAVSAVLAGRAAAELESDVLDFKREGRSRDETMRDLAEAAACFANATGGVVIVGVQDSPGGVAALVGTGLDALLLKRRIFELTDPHLTLEVLEVHRAQVRLLALLVAASPDVHAVAGRSTERIGTSCHAMSPGRIAAVVADRRGDDWSAVAAPESADALDVAALEETRSLLSRSSAPGAHRLATAPVPALLSGLGVLAPDGALTRAAVLLLGRSEDGFVYTHRRTDAGALTANEHITGPLVLGLRRVLDLLSARTDRTSVNLPGGQQLQVADLPDEAVREAVVNAAMHRDYRRSGLVQVEHAATRLTVTSPGPFMPGVTKANVLTTSSRMRNPCLAGAVRMLGLAETAGSGVDRMYAAMGRGGHHPPDYGRSDEQAVVVTLRGGAVNGAVARFVATLPAEEREDADAMLTLLTLLERRTVTAALLAPLMQKPEDEAQTVLERLASDHVRMLERTRESATRARPTYRLREHAVAALQQALRYRRRSADEYDRKIVALVRESGEINSRTVQIVLDLQVQPASRVLADLVERGILRKTSAAQRGPAVTYGPGPHFPAGPMRTQRRRARSTSAHTPQEGTA